MSPKKSEDSPLKKTEKEKRRTEEKIREIYFGLDMEMVEKLKKGLESRERLQIPEERDA